jgi:hypothetical protein
LKPGVRILAGLATLVAFALWWDARQPVARVPGVTAAEAPFQQELEDAAPIVHGDFVLTPLARFSLVARILSREEYWADVESELVPTDFVLGWGRMSDSAVLDEITITQSTRWYHWTTFAPPIPVAEIESSSANMHLIAGNPEVARILAAAKPGQILAVSGYLVRAVRPSDGWTWTSSLSRTDTGAGSCEIVYVEAAGVR